jgi:ribosomal protein S18 acetylase RimI-like enzyme
MAEPRSSHSTTFVVRDAIESDLDGILDLYTRLHAHDTAPPPRALLAEIWSNILADPSLRYFVGACGGQLVSSCNLAVIPNLTRGARPFGVIENVVTHPDYRRQGFAQAVLEHALDAAWQAGCYKVMLLSSAHRDAAHILYERVGFKKGVKTGFVARPSQ